ncbi:MAG: beta-ketoacyl-ACP synthase III [Candidatus Sericytochromatia bacterium]|nr:beta-ketoacyl-ACP synthase III [Candidatus Sericytochromatia bacterium]
MRPRRLKIRGLGTSLPARAVTAAELDRNLGLEEGWVARHSGVLVRYHATDETASEMGAKAARAALDDAGLDFEDLDLLVGACGTPEQAIPCNAALIQKALGKEESGIPAFDVNSTCLSFVTALDVVASLIESGRYRRALVVSSEIASVGLNPREIESATILGDGAAAAVVERTPEGESAAVVCARMETYSSGSELTRTRGGGSRYHPRRFDGDLATYAERFTLFEMDGRAVFRLSAQILPGFIDRMLTAHGLVLDDFHMVIPHQASPTALWLMQRRLGIPEARWMVIAPEFGNTVAASIPMALTMAVRQGRVKRGDRLMLLGTSAGFSVGAMVLDY